MNTFDSSLVAEPAAAKRPARVEALLGELRELRQPLRQRFGSAEPGAFEHALESLFEVGAFALTIPRAHQGFDCSAPQFCAAIAQLAQIDASLTMAAVPHLANGVGSVAHFGTDSQKSEIFANLCGERGLIAFAATESHTGSDIAAHKSSLAEADGAYVLRGSKTWITNVPWARHIVVLARHGESSTSSLVVVRAQDRGFEIGNHWDKLAVPASPTVDLYFDSVRLPTDRLLGVRGRGMQQFQQVVRWGRLGAAAAALGTALAALHWLGRQPSARDSEFFEASVDATRLAAAVLATTASRVGDAGTMPETAVDLCKVFCARQAINLVQSAFLFSCRHGLESREIRQLQRDVGLFGVLEGPSDLLEQRAALALLTQVDRYEARQLFQTKQGASVADDFLQTLLTMRSRWRAEGRRLGASPVTLSQVGDLAALVYAESCAAHAPVGELGVELSAYDGNMQRAEERLRAQVASKVRAFSMFDN